MSSKLIISQKFLPQCEEGDREAWLVFLGSYTPVALKLLDFYLPESRGNRQRQLWKDTLGALAAGGYERLRSFEHIAERAFLVDLRAFLLEFGRPAADGGGDASGAPWPSADNVRSLLKDLPLVHQQITFLKLAGYSDATIEKILRVPPSIASKSLERLGTNYSASLNRTVDSCPWPAAWLELLQHARVAQTPECPTRHLLLRVLDGQTTWYEKTPAEEHMSRCLHCLESWIALCEVNCLRNETRPLPLAEVDDLLAFLPVTGSTKGRAPFLKRLFGS